MLHIHTDHLNITTINTTPDHVIWWLNYIKQCNPYIHLIPDNNIVIADTLSWLDCLDKSVLFKDKQVFVSKDFVSKGVDFANDPCLIECFLYLPPMPVQDKNPTDYQWIFIKQNKTVELVKQWQNVQKDTSIKYMMTKKSSVMQGLVTTATHIGNLP